MMTAHSNRNLSGWSLDYGYESRFNKDEYPMRLIETGPLANPIFALRLTKNDARYQCNDAVHGFKVILTMPGDTLERTHKFQRVHAGKYGLMRLNVNEKTTSNKLREYTPSQRQCFFNAERRLRFFKMYTQNNCEAECLANFTKIACGCVKFSMPRETICSF